MSEATEHIVGRLVTFGETMGLFAATQIGSFGFDQHFTLGIGGAESNVAVGAARLGVPVTWFGRVGTDALGDLIERRLRVEGIDTLAIRDSRFTGIMVKHSRFSGALNIDYHRAGDAGSRLAPDDIPVSVVSAAAILHITGITPALSESAHRAVFRAVELARAAGVAVSLDVNYRAKLWKPESARPVLRDLASKADIVFAGREEADLVLGISAESARAAAAGIASLGPAEAVIKDGSRGCTAVIDQRLYELPAIPVEVVDPVGAGDAFVAGYLAERLEGETAETRLATAVTTGAMAVSVPGDCEGFARRSELAAWERGDVWR
jgi:2-dehydro-3-deoxygluconokinase